MRWIGSRPRTLLTRTGRVTVVRAYYHCRACGRGHAPADGACQVPPSQATWAVQDRVALLGTWLPFRRAAAVYAHLTGQPVSAGSVEHWTEAVGAAAVPPVDRSASGPAVDTLFVQVDAVLVRFDDGWHEVKVAVCWGRVDGEDLPPRYLTAQGTWEALTAPLADLARRRQGLRRARQVICMADGAKPIWKLLHRLFPQARCLLEWYHVHEPGHRGPPAAGR